jgi:hypothetical protein
MTKIFLGLDGLPLANLGDPTHDGEREFFITLKDKSDETQFLEDMASIAGTSHIPNRPVNVGKTYQNLRSNSHFITHDEAVKLAHDPRILAVELNLKDRGAKIDYHSWSTTGTFSKAFYLNATDINWGLYRTYSTANTANWGSGNNTLPGTTVQSQLTGKNVDVVVFDAAVPWPTTYEFWQNPAPSGYSRQVLFPWNDEFFVYAAWPGMFPAIMWNEHDAHTTGTVAGNTQGFARDANIYNAIIGFNLFDAIINFQRSKPVNPSLGVPNPTITNNSWGYSIGATADSFMQYVSQINYRGVLYYPTSGSEPGSYIWDFTILAGLKIPNEFGNGFPVQDAATDAAFILGASEGIINVASAGNSFFYVDKLGGLDYNNWLYLDAVGLAGVYYYNRGSSPAAAVDLLAAPGHERDNSPISVGAFGAVQTGETGGTSVLIVYGFPGYTLATGLLATDYKSEFSNYGPGVDVFAPGECITSVILSSAYLGGGGAAGTNVPDPRTTNVGIDVLNNVFNKDAGTSMAGPHVAGVLACLLEQYPTMTMLEARQWIQQNSLPTLQSTSGGTNDGTDSAGSNNLILFMPQTRIAPANVGGYQPIPYPVNNGMLRPAAGQVWPQSVPRVTATAVEQTYRLSADRTTINTISKYGISPPAHPNKNPISNIPGCIMIDGNDWLLPFTGTGWLDVFQPAGPGLFGTESWTFECWINFYFLPGIYGLDTEAIIIKKGTNSAYDLDIRITLADSNWYVNLAWNAVNIPPMTLQSSALPGLSYATWYHLAVVNTVSGAVIYWNGVAVCSSTPLTGFTDGINYFTLGRSFSEYSPQLNGRPIVDVPFSNFTSAPSTHGMTGFISNLRICKGVAVYTGNFTVPSAPLQSTQSAGTNISAITGNQCTLLTLQYYDATGQGCVDSSHTSTLNQIGQWVFYTADAIVANAGSAGDPLFAAPNTLTFSWAIDPFTNTGENTAVVTLATTGVLDGTQIKYMWSSTYNSLTPWDLNGDISIAGNSLLVGVMTVTGGTATLPVTFTSTQSIPIWLRLDVFGTEPLLFQLNYT